MAWYEGTYKCGHNGQVNIVGPSKNRESKRNYIFDAICPDCYREKLQKEREIKNKEAELAAKEMELPDIMGSPAQIKWANTIRIDTINWLDDYFDRVEKKKEEKGGNLEAFRDRKVHVLNALDYGIKSHADARFWIDNRIDTNDLILLFVQEYDKFLDKAIPADIAEEIAKEEEQLTVMPEGKSKPGVVLIREEPEGTLSISYTKDDELRMAAKARHYEFDWDSRSWVRKIDEYSGKLDDRAADIGNHLLSKGFTVRFMNAGQMHGAIEGSFEPECEKWVKLREGNGMLAISWASQNDSIYRAAKKLSGAKWDKGSMIVPVSHYGQVQDFADIMGFRISKAAKQAILTYKTEEAGYIQSPIQSPAVEHADDTERLRKILKSAGTIIEDLIDEP